MAEGTGGEAAPGARRGIRVPPPLYFAAALAGGWLAGRLWPVPFLDALPFAARLGLGFGLIAVAFAFVLSAIRAFQSAETTVLPYRRPSAFVAVGPYRFSRNPMYVGLAGISLGIAVLVGNLWMVASVPLAMAAVHFLVIPGEEERLEAAFGDDYRAYKRAVRRWF